MITLSQSQYDRLLQGNPQQFVETIHKHIADSMPDEIRGIPTHLVNDMISCAIDRARKHDLTTDEQIIAYVSVMFEVAPNFDEEPVLRALLEDRSKPPAERWNSLFANTPSLYAAWERAAHPGFYDPNAWIESDIP